MSSYTLGPWVRSGGTVYSERSQCVVVRLPIRTDCFGDEAPEQLERWDADARLIAAAPDLLEALKALLQEYEDMRCQFGSDPIWRKFESILVVEEARRAIHEAGGEMG